LGIAENASVDDIKKAYRERAKLFHPDLNKESNAHEKFVLINEAYEFLMEYKAGKHRTIKIKTTEEQLKEARARAAAHARMRYKAFTQTAYYKSTASLADMLDVLISLASLIVFMLITVFAYKQNGTSGLIGALIIDILGIAVIYMITLNRSDITVTRYLHSFLYFIQWRYSHLTFLVLINIWIFIKIGFNTLISTEALAGIYVLLPLLLFYLLRYTGNQKPQLISFGLLPAFISLLLIINFTFSGPQSHEAYYYHLAQDETGRESTLIYLEGDVYHEFTGVRLFLNFSEVISHNVIHYQTAKGLLGIRVVKSYAFSREAINHIKAADDRIAFFRF
jgi:hypothetical protein